MGVVFGYKLPAWRQDSTKKAGQVVARAGMTTISGSRTDQPARRAKPSAPRSDDRGSKPPPTVPDRSREVKVHCGRAEFATFGGGGVDRRRRGGIQSRARPSPPVPRASCVASCAADRRSASCRHLSGRSHQARLATRDTADDPARSARASARGASGARAAASNHWRLQLQQRAAARSIDLMGAAKKPKRGGRLGAGASRRQIAGAPHDRSEQTTRTFFLTGT